jgi:hypothetical protein
LATRHQLAEALTRQGRFADAEPRFAEILAARQRILGPDHPATQATSEALQLTRAQLASELD